jgi:hypothetical protein
LQQFARPDLDLLGVEGFAQASGNQQRQQSGGQFRVPGNRLSPAAACWHKMASGNSFHS